MAAAPGATDVMLQWLGVANEARAAQWLTQIQNPGNPQAVPKEIFRRIAPLVGKLELPPLLWGFKASAQRKDLDAAIEKGLAKLPSVQRSSFKLDGSYPFSLVSAEVGQFIPPDKLTKLQAAIEPFLEGDAAAKKAFLDSLLSHHVEIAYGWVDDYLLVSVGSNHEHLRLAGKADQSVLSQKAVAHAAQFIDKQPVSFAYISKESLAKIPYGFRFSEWLGRFEPDLKKELSPEELAQIKADASRLDGEANAVMQPQRVDPVLQVSYWQNGLHIERFGGIAVPGLTTGSTSIALPGALRQSCFLWISANAVADTNAKEWALIEDFATTAWRVWQRFGVPKIPAEGQQQYAVGEQVVIPKLVELYKVLCTVGKGLGTSEGWLMDFKGAYPPTATPPPTNDGKPMMLPRVACIAEITDPAMISKAASDYDIWFQGVAKLAGPQFAANVKFKTETSDGVSRYFYELPQPTGEHVPNLAIAGDRWVLGSSMDLSKKLATEANFSGPPLALDLRLNLRTGLDQLAKIIPHPAPTSKLDASFVFSLLRAFPDIESRVFEENGESRRSSTLFIEDSK
jgi:hypothetical protein